ncbi:hypothetical protein TNCV_4574991 [Trichonephila clavipes]|nr:hypothetical protein TNCV_4574991 [Trichonephila clavipes]
MGRKLRAFLPSHPGQLKPTFDVERAREALRKRQIIQNKYANKHATVLPLLPQNAKERMGRVFRKIRFHIRQDKTENDNPRWSRSVEDLYNHDATEISRNPNDSADRQINASPKTEAILTNNFKFQLKHLVSRAILRYECLREIY